MATKIITVHFTTAGVPATGISPTIDIYDVLTNTLIVSGGSMSEIGGGWYKYSFATYSYTSKYVFTFDGGGTLVNVDRYKSSGNESHKEDISYAVLDEPITDHTITGSVADTVSKTKADTTTVVLNGVTFSYLINLILKYEQNRTKIDTANAQLLVYDDDNTTLIQAFNLFDVNGNPSVAEVLERVPTM
jgi:hypothetical protein